MAIIPVKLKRSATPGKIPTTAQLPLGEIAINTFDGKAYLKKDDGTESIVELGSSGGYTAPRAIVLYNKDGSGSTASFDGIETRFQVRDDNGSIPAILTALTLSVSVNGVVQKPNEGTPGTFEGFYITANGTAGSDIVFSDAPATGADFFGILGGMFAATGGTSAITYIDDISASFDGVTTDFTLQVNGSNYAPDYSVGVLVTLGGVVQIPTDSYSITGSTISFTQAPPTGTSFHAVDFRLGPSADMAAAIITASDTPPEDPADGQLWYDGVGGRVYLWYNDGTSSQWVDAAPATVGGTVQLGGGTGASPSLTFATDTDTGVYSSTANNLAFATGGSGRVFIDGSGNVGINNSSPTDRLTIYNASSDVWIRTHTSTYNAYTGVNTGSGTIDTYVASNHPYRIVTNNLERLRVTADGRVGINTNTPSSQLHVESANNVITSKASSGYAGVLIDSAGASESYIFFHNSGTNRARIAADSNNTIRFTQGASATETARFSAAGNFAVGHANPRARLQTTGAGFVSSPTLGSIDNNVPFYLTNADSSYGLVAGVDSSVGTVWMQSQRTDGTATAYPISLNPVGGKVCVGHSTGFTAFSVTGDALSPGTQPFGDYQGNGQFFITGKTNTNKRLALGVDTSATEMIGVIQSIEPGIATRSLAINPNGGNVGIATSAPDATFDVRGYSRFGRYSGTYQGISLANNNDSSAAETVSFIDAKNNLDITDSDLFFVHNTNGSSHVQFGTTPAGSRTADRRRLAFRVTGDREVQVYQDPGRATIDTSVSATSVANGGTIDFANASGLFLVNNHTNGGVTLYLCGAGAVAVLGNTGNQVGTLVYNAGINGYRFTNNSGSTATFGFFTIRTRPNA